MSPTSPAEGSFRFAAASGLRCRQWGDELAVYDALQARTHLLGATAAAVLMHLAQNELVLTVGELAQAVLLDPDGNDPEPLSADEQVALTRCIDELVRLGLVETRPS